MKKQKQSTPPPINTSHGSASDRTHLEWVLKSQNEIAQTVGELKSDSKHVTEALNRLESGQKDLLNKIEENDKKISGISTKLLIFVAVFTTAITVSGFFINGQATKTAEFMHNLVKSEQQRTTAEK